jgi:iron-sulfur cluster insertion protein
MIEFTDAAALKMQEVLEEEGDSTLNLRVLIQGGGCSGFQYGFTLDKEQTELDVVVENQGVKLLVDPVSAQYLEGARIDYTS